MGPQGRTCGVDNYGVRFRLNKECLLGYSSRAIRGHTCGLTHKKKRAGLSHSDLQNAHVLNFQTNVTKRMMLGVIRETAKWVCTSTISLLPKL